MSVFLVAITSFLLGLALRPDCQECADFDDEVDTVEHVE